MSDQKEEFKTVGEMIESIEIAMLTSVDKETGVLESRPMATVKREFDGKVYFFTNAAADKTSDAATTRQVNVAYSDIDSEKYVSLSGSAKVLRDRETLEKYWNPLLKAWFPEGLEDPNLALLEIEVSRAEYWKGVSSRIVQFLEIVRATLTGTTANLGENKKVNVEAASK